MGNAELRNMTNDAVPKAAKYRSETMDMLRFRPSKKISIIEKSRNGSTPSASLNGEFIARSAKIAAIAPKNRAAK